MVRHTHPYLLVSIAAADEDIEFKTIVASQLDTAPQEQFVAPVAKREGANTFSFISIGRSRNNDIVINANSVSKSHAFIARTETGYTIADAGSRNGTLVDGQPLEPRKPVPLRVGALIQFSPRVTAQVVDESRARNGR